MSKSTFLASKPKTISLNHASVLPAGLWPLVIAAITHVTCGISRDLAADRIPHVMSS
jgi:uncharacterized membrane protein YeiH